MAVTTIAGWIQGKGPRDINGEDERKCDFLILFFACGAHQLNRGEVGVKNVLASGVK